MPKKDLAPYKSAAQRNPRSQSLSKNLNHLTLVVDFLTTMLPKSLKVILHGFERFGGIER